MRSSCPRGAVTSEVKARTTEDITSGTEASLSGALGGSSEDRDISRVMIGTTHFTNAVLTGTDLARVAVARVGLPASASLPAVLQLARRARRHRPGAGLCGRRRARMRRTAHRPAQRDGGQPANRSPAPAGLRAGRSAHPADRVGAHRRASWPYLSFEWFKVRLRQENPYRRFSWMPSLLHTGTTERLRNGVTVRSCRYVGLVQGFDIDSGRGHGAWPASCPRSGGC